MPRDGYRNGSNYLKDGEVVGKSGDVAIYKWEDRLFLNIGKDMWALECELEDYKKEIKDYPKGDCLEIGLGLGVASRHILSFPEVKSLLTIEINYDVIKTQRQANYINDRRHTIFHMDAFDYVETTDKEFDFVFLDFYTHIDYDTVEVITEMARKSAMILKDDGKMAGWIRPGTEKQYLSIFERNNYGNNSSNRRTKKWHIPNDERLERIRV